MKTISFHFSEKCSTGDKAGAQGFDCWLSRAQSPCYYTQLPPWVEGKPVACWGHWPTWAMNGGEPFCAFRDGPNPSPSTNRPGFSSRRRCHKLQGDGVITSTCHTGQWRRTYVQGLGRLVVLVVLYFFPCFDFGLFGGRLFLTFLFFVGLFCDVCEGGWCSGPIGLTCWFRDLTVLPSPYSSLGCHTFQVLFSES